MCDNCCQPWWPAWRQSTTSKSSGQKVGASPPQKGTIATRFHMPSISSERDLNVCTRRQWGQPCTPPTAVNGCSNPNRKDAACCEALRPYLSLKPIFTSETRTSSILDGPITIPHPK